MTEQVILPNAIFPDLPRDPKLVNKEGNINDYWSLFFNNLSQALQVNFSNEGIKFPPLDIDQLNYIAGLYTPYIGVPLPQDAPGGNQNIFLPDISGASIFDTTNRVPKVFIITFDGSTPPNVLTAGWKTYTIT